MAPASLQPSQPLVLVTELPLAVVLTRLVHVTAWPLLGDGGGAEDGGGVGAGAGAGAGAGVGAGAAAPAPAMAAAIAVKSTPTSLPSVPARAYGLPVGSAELLPARSTKPPAASAV